MRRVLVAAVFLALAAPAGALTIRQLPGQQGCFYMRRADAGCRKSNGMQGANDVAVTPDGKFVYAVSGFEDYGALLSFKRNPQTGALTQLPGHHGCISNDGRNAQANLQPKRGIGVRGKCGQAGPIPGAASLVISPDGQAIYVLGQASFRRDGDSITVFRRNAQTGYVHEVQCWTRIGTPHCPRTPISEPATLAITPDGRELIAGGQSLTTFAVGADGRLSSPSCTYTADALLSSNDCPKGTPRMKDLMFVSALGVSPDSATVYSAGGGGPDGQLLALRRDPATGALTPQTCIGTVKTTCPAGRAIASPRDVAVAPDGTGVYVAAAYLEQPDGARDILHSSALLGFTANPFAQPAGTIGCAVYQGRNRNPGCSAGPGLYEPQTIAITPDGLHAVAGFIDSAAVLLLDRDPATQQLTAVPGKGGCVRSAHQWVDNKVTLPCHSGHGLYAPLGIALSPDGRNAYLASDDGLAVLSLQ